MIDVHSHLLPLVDDGSDSEELSLYLLKQAGLFGVTDMILTPHYKEGFKTSPEELKEIFSKFNQKKNEQGINVNLYLGNEIHYGKNTRKHLKDCSVLTLNGTKYVLVEFDYFKPIDATEVVYALIYDGFIPIVAHVERYVYISISDVLEIKSMGGLIQVNAGSLVGDVKGRLKRRVKKLIKLSLVDFIASDAHASRHNYLKSAYDYVNKKFGNETANKLFIENAKKIIGQA
jgi:protein-tyrosine phosphatase